jgi:hypothetical protein
MTLSLSPTINCIFRFRLSFCGERIQIFKACEQLTAINVDERWIWEEYSHTQEVRRAKWPCRSTVLLKTVLGRLSVVKCLETSNEFNPINIHPIKNTNVRHLTPCSPVDFYLRFGGKVLPPSSVSKFKPSKKPTGNSQNYWVFGLFPSSGILENTTFRKLNLFPSSGEGGGEDTYDLESTNRKLFLLSSCWLVAWITFSP